MGYFPTNRKITCNHPRPHRAMNQEELNVAVCKDCQIQTFCDGTPCMKDLDHHDNYWNLPYLQMLEQAKGLPGHHPGTMCMHDPYYYMHGNMHIDPCYAGKPIDTTPIYTYDYDKQAYIPNYRGDNGLVLNIDYKLKTSIQLDILYENGERLSGEITEGNTYDFIYADSGVLKRDIGELTNISVSQLANTTYDTRLGFDNSSITTTATLTFNCSTNNVAHVIKVDLNLLRSIVYVEPEDDLPKITIGATKYDSLKEALAASGPGDVINGNGIAIGETEIDHICVLDNFKFHGKLTISASCVISNSIFSCTIDPSDDLINDSYITIAKKIKRFELRNNTFDINSCFKSVLAINNPVAHITISGNNFYTSGNNCSVITAKYLSDENSTGIVSNEINGFAHIMTLNINEETNLEKKIFLERNKVNNTVIEKFGSFIYINPMEDKVTDDVITGLGESESDDDEYDLPSTDEDTTSENVDSITEESESDELPKEDVEEEYKQLAFDNYTIIVRNLLFNGFPVKSSRPNNFIKFIGYNEDLVDSEKLPNITFI